MIDVKIILLLVSVLLQSSCDKTENSTVLRIRNETIDSVYYQFSWSHPDTTIADFNPLNDSYNYLILPFSEKRVNARNSKNYDYWAELFSDGKKEYLFIFHADTLLNNDWESVRSDYKILRRIELSRDLLQKNNWVIMYK
ncbi:hypothetical protein AAG747_28580 [Rapidithrix thailandica]|uniref:Lipoprotein n=1 Tax=Rapidithrix thailandica TaxID=413964 RepID=A0AAW9SGE1_9BACT